MGKKKRKKEKQRAAEAASATAAPIVKAPRGATLSGAVGIGTTGATNPVWSEANTRRHLTEWVYSAVRATSSRIAGQPVKVGRKVRSSNPSGSKAAGNANPAASGANVKELPAHPLSELLDYPNLYTTESQLIGLVVSALEVSGQAFLWFDREPGDEAARLWFIPSGWCREDPDAETPLTKWIVRAENSADELNLDASELIRISYPDPANPFRALSPLMACFRSVVCDEQIIDSQLATFDNGGRPGLLVKVGSDAASSPMGDADDVPALTEVQRRVFRQRIKEATSGAANAGEPIILDAIIKEVTRITNTPAEMDFTASSLLTRDRVLAAFGVPKVSLGMTDDANRASAVVADETFCFSKCGPICRLISDHLTNFFRVAFNDADLVVWIEAPRPRDPDGRRADLEQLARYGSLTVDELRGEHGLAPLADGAGKVLVNPRSANQSVNPPAEPAVRDDQKNATVNVTVNSAPDVFPADHADDRKDADSLNRLNAALNAGRLKRIVLDEHTPAPSEN